MIYNTKTNEMEEKEVEEKVIRKFKEKSGTNANDFIIEMMVLQFKYAGIETTPEEFKGDIYKYSLMKPRLTKEAQVEFNKELTERAVKKFGWSLSKAVSEVVRFNMTYGFETEE